MRYQISFQQHAIVQVEYNLEVPEEVVAQGEQAVEDYLIENEADAQDTETDVIDWQNHVHGSYEVEEI